MRIMLHIKYKKLEIDIEDLKAKNEFKTIK